MMTLSIIIPVYNTPLNYLKECLLSIENSIKGHHYEILIVDDGSTDEPLLTFLSHHSHPRTQVFHQENRGPSSARNFGFEKARGSLILCFDSDDIMLPQINNAISFLKENAGYSVVYCDVETFGTKNELFKTGNFSIFKHIYLTLIPFNPSIFRREILEKVPNYNPNFKSLEDWDFWSRVAYEGYKFKYLPTPFFRYRRIFNKKSLSQQDSNRKQKELNEQIGRGQYDARKIITQTEINNFVINNFKDNKKYLTKLILQIFFPKFFNFLVKKGVLKNNIVIG